MIESIQDKALKRFWTQNDAKGIHPEWRKKVRRLMLAIDAATEPGALDLPGFGFHPLKGELAGRYALTVSRNWRLTFGWDGKNATGLDLEDYHGD